MQAGFKINGVSYYTVQCCNINMKSDKQVKVTIFK